MLVEEQNAKRANEMADQAFWDKVHTALAESNFHQHDEVLERAEKYAQQMPEKNSYVRELIQNSLIRLRRSQAYLARNVLHECGLTEEQTEKMFGLPTGNAQDFTPAPRELKFGQTSFNPFQDQAKALHENRLEKMAGILRMHVGTNILDDLRESTKFSFDAMKYDIYNRDVPKSPADMQSIAYELVDVGTAFRKQFLGRITSFANAIVDDVKDSRKRSSGVPVGVNIDLPSEEDPGKIARTRLSSTTTKPARKHARPKARMLLTSEASPDAEPWTGQMLLST